VAKIIGITSGAGLGIKTIQSTGARVDRSGREFISVAFCLWAKDRWPGLDQSPLV
jgi:hypothetical protein